MADCVDNPSGSNNTQATSCPAPSDWTSCNLWDLTQTQDQCYIDSLVQEGVNVAGAQVNVWKLLGIQEQTKLVDLTGNGNAISGGDLPNFPASNAFNTFNQRWISAQSGIAVTQSSYLGYDFGNIKLTNGRDRYGIDTNIRHQITAIKIKQSSKATERATKIRVERSDNGTQWYGVAIVSLPDNDQLNLVTFKSSVPNRFWRIRPVTFGGSSDCGATWTVYALELFDYEETKLDNIQDKILLENRNRDYAQQASKLKGYYDLITISSELTRIGIEIPSSRYQIKIPFSSCVAVLGRPIVIGDIIELPSETQYTPDLRPVKRYLEVTDVTWDSGSYTPGWQPTMLLVSTEPAMATEETQSIFGDLAKHIDSSEVFDNDDGNSTVWQDYSNIDQTIKADARSEVPERGSDGSDVVREFTQQEKDQAAAVGVSINKIGFNPTGLYVEDAMPQNGAPYSQGPSFPTSPTDGDYHRMTYDGLSKDVPIRLYRWSTVKGRWIYLETDKREKYNYQQELLDEYLTSPNGAPSKDIR